MTETSKTAEKALAILQELSDGDPATPQQIALRMGVNRTVVQRLLTTLLYRGFVTRSDGEYSLAPRVRTLAAAVLPELQRAVRSPIVVLSKKTRETIVFQVLDGSSVVVVDEAVHVRGIALHVRQEVGSRSPITLSASGLAILAWLERSASARLLRSSTDTESAATITTTLAEIREAGFAVTTNELRLGVSGLACPVLRDDLVIGSVAILVPTSRASNLDGYRSDLARTAAAIANALR